MKRMKFVIWVGLGQFFKPLPRVEEHVGTQLMGDEIWVVVEFESTSCPVRVGPNSGFWAGPSVRPNGPLERDSSDIVVEG
jgi:hypothetical protein